MSSPSDRTLASGCSCGQVGYQVDDAFDDALISHCSDCRRMTRSACKPFAGIPRGRLALIRGAGRLMVHGDDLTNNAHGAGRGSLQVSVLRDGTWGRVAKGALIDTPAIRPSAHIFVGSKAPWHDLTDDLPQYQEFPA